MKSICLIFQIHQPYRLKRYRFFDIGRDHYYYDDFANDEIVSRIGRNSYLPTLQTLRAMHGQYGDRLRVAISITSSEKASLLWKAWRLSSSFRKTSLPSGSVTFSPSSSPSTSEPV